MAFLDRYKKGFKGDFTGGVTAAIVAIPLGLGFGGLSGLGAEAGLYAAIILAIIASIIGGTQTLISDPTAPMAFVAGAIISTGIDVNGGVLGDHAWVHIILTFALAGLFQILFGFLKIAQYVRFIPYPVISGFMGGIGIIIMIGQLFPIMGHTSPKGAINIFSEISQPLGNINTWALTLGLGTIALIYIVPLVSKKIPSVLVALITMTLISYFAMPEGEFGIVGSFKSGLPSPKIAVLANIQFQDILNVMVPAITLASLGTIDTLLTSVVADNMTKTKHNGNRELMGQGLGNFVGAFFGALPGAGSTTGTVINIKSGATTHMSGIIKGVFLILVLLFLAPKNKQIDEKSGADTKAIDVLKQKMEDFKSKYAKIPTLTDLMIILAVGFGATGFSHFMADIIGPFIGENYPFLSKFSLTSKFFWLIVIATSIGVTLSFTRANKLEGVGASRVGSAMLYVLVAAIGMHMDITALVKTPSYFVVGMIWMAIHAVTLLVVAKLVKAPLFFMAVGSQANVGGAASAPVVATAFHPSLATVGVLLAVFGYAIGTVAAIGCTILMSIASS